MNSKHCINLLRKKAMRNISFASFDAHKLPIFGKLNLIKFSPNLISFCNCLFIYKHFLSSMLFMSIRSQNGHFRKNRFVFSNLFILTYDTHEKNTRLVSYGLLKKRSWSSSEYATNAFAASGTKSWNIFQKMFSNDTLCQLSYCQLRVLIKNQFFNSYDQDCG